jgi:hypothetical protein
MDKNRAALIRTNLLAIIADPQTSTQSRERAQGKADALAARWGL